MTSTQEWFAVDRVGLSKLLEERGAPFAVLELIQNALDTNAKNISVTLTKTVGRRGLYDLTVVDDDPDGFSNLAHAFTLFAESEKKNKVNLRGRFNLGEKLVLALCETAVIRSTKGAVSFDEKGRHDVPKGKTDVGSAVEMVIRLQAADAREVERLVRTVLIPEDITVTFNGTLLEERKPIRVVRSSLPTVIAGANGVLKNSARQTDIRLIDLRDGEKPHLYELGIPVVEIDLPFHCVAPDTKILTADLRYVSAGAIEEGMSLLGFDEERVGNRRSFRSSEVKDVRRALQPSYRLTFDDGTVVVCSDNHQWLTSWGTNKRRWLPTSRLLPTRGAKAGSRVVRLLDVWETDDSRSSGYLAGLYDGEGSLNQRVVSNPNGVANQLVFTQNDGVVLDATASLLRDRGYTFSTQRVERTNPAWLPTTQLVISRRPDLLRLLGSVRPDRLLNKLNVDMLGSIPTSRSARLVAKEFLGDTEVVVIQTTTSTYIAEGLASHNCDVQQKVPLGFNRDSVTPAYARALHVAVVNQATDLVATAASVSKGWVGDALESKDISPEAVRAILETKYEDISKVLVYDPTDREARTEAQSLGYEVIGGRTFTAPQWENIRQHVPELLPRAGLITPSRNSIMRDTEEEIRTHPEVTVSPADYTAQQAKVVEYCRTQAAWLLGRPVSVRVVRSDNKYLASWGSSQLTLNLRALWPAWWSNEQQIDEIIIHEVAHSAASDHLDHRFYESVIKFGAKLRNSALRLS